MSEKELDVTPKRRRRKLASLKLVAIVDNCESEFRQADYPCEALLNADMNVINDNEVEISIFGVQTIPID